MKLYEKIRRYVIRPSLRDEYISLLEGELDSVFGKRWKRLEEPDRTFLCTLRNNLSSEIGNYLKSRIKRSLDELMKRVENEEEEAIRSEMSKRMLNAIKILDGDKPEQYDPKK